MRDLPSRPNETLELLKIDATARAAPEAARLEPVLEASPAVVEFDSPARPDPAALDAGRATMEPEPPTPVSRRTAPALGLIGSLAIHLLPLLVLLDWTGAPAEIVQAIPVQFVMEEPPPPPPPTLPEMPPPPGRLASDNIGESEPKPEQPLLGAGHTAGQPEETRVASVAPPPKPTPPPELVSALPKPAVPPEPKPAVRLERPVKEAVVARLAPSPHPAPRAQVPGPTATRDAYLAYCMTLVRRHFGRLSPSFLAGRRGTTLFRLDVLDNGTIARITVTQRSPYADIDARIEEAIAAVRRFPPLPQWFQGPRISLLLQVSYPDGL